MSTPSSGRISRREFLGLFGGLSRRKPTQERPPPRLVRKIIFGYQSALPAAMVTGAERLRDKIQKAGLKVSVAYHRLPEIPEDADIILVREDLRDAAQQRAPGAQILPMAQFEENVAYGQLVARLVEGVELRADVQDPAEEAPRAKSIRFRGNRKLG